MLNAANPVKYSKGQRQYIKKLGTPRYEDWSVNNKINNNIKKTIRYQLLIQQNNRCAYCGLKLFETSRPEIEHIAPRRIHPEFEYINKNLVIACQYCNSSSRKGSYDTIAVKTDYYNACQFNIVNPYYDDTDKYFDEETFIIKIKSGLPENMRKKAEKTFEIFKIDDPLKVEARAKQVIFDRCRQNYSLSELAEKLLNEISTYN